jgi:hypothetical protein
MGSGQANFNITGNDIENRGDIAPIVAFLASKRAFLAISGFPKSQNDLNSVIEALAS